MHIHGFGPDSNNKPKMSGGAVDNRVRRQQPVNTSRTPRIRQGGRSLSLVSGRHTAQEPKHQHTHSWHGGRNYGKGGDSRDLHDATSQSFDGVGGRNGLDNASPSFQNSRPLIHHQRHNLKNRFQIIKTLGEGTYGKVKLASDCSTGEHVAIKYIKKTKIHDHNDLVRIRREIQILSSLKHRHIVNIREVFEKKDKIVLVMDYAQGGELYDYLNRKGRLGERDARRVFRQIVAAIHYCHSNGIVHRDLKLENIILDHQGNVKIADFGLSNYYSHNATLKTFCGSPLYASPEIVNGKPYHGPEVDVWSLGVVLYTLVYGAMPFESNSLISLKTQISEGDYDQPEKPSDAAGLIRHMLTVTPSRRATMDDALRHWWVNFGHAHMPNDAPYSPDDDPPIRTSSRSSHALTTSVSSSSSSSSSSFSSSCLLHSGGGASTNIIHQRNQSSISSDSDLELDFRPVCLAKMAASTLVGEVITSDTSDSLSQHSMMHVGSSSSSSSFSTSSTPSSSSASTPSMTGCLTTPADFQVKGQNGDNVSLSCEFPTAMLDLLNECGNPSIANFLATGKISTGFHSTHVPPPPSPPPSPPPPSPPPPSHTHQMTAASTVPRGGGGGGDEDRPKSEKEAVDKINGASIFDSERKPKRGILKRRGKFSGGDSGCVMHEEMVPQVGQDTPMPKSGHLPKRLPSFRGEANGMFASRHRISQLLDQGANSNDNNNVINDSSNARAINESTLTSPSDFDLGSHRHSPHSVPHTHPEPSSQSLPLLHQHQQQQQINPSPQFMSMQSSPEIEQQQQQHHHHHRHPHDKGHAACTPPNVDAVVACGDRYTCSQHTDAKSSFDADQVVSLAANPCANPVPKNRLAHDLELDLDLQGQAYRRPPAWQHESAEQYQSRPSVADANFNPVPANSNLDGNGAASRCLSRVQSNGKDSSDFERIVSSKYHNNYSNSNNYNNSTTASNSYNNNNNITASNSYNNNYNTASNSCSNYTDTNATANTNNINSNNAKDATSSSSASKVVRRPKSILKTSKLTEARNRLSVSSIGSNSSADFLDLSYDSADCDHYINTRAMAVTSPEDVTSSSSRHSSPPDSVDGGDSRNSLYLDEDFQVLKTIATNAITTTTAITTTNAKISAVDDFDADDTCPSFSGDMANPATATATASATLVDISNTSSASVGHNGRLRPCEAKTFPVQMDGHGNPIFVESESPMLYRLAKEASGLTLH